MTTLAFGHRLETLHDGLCVVDRDGVIHPRPMPLQHTDIHVAIAGGLATARTTRRFANTESVPIEVIMTFPVGFDAVVTGLSVMVDGRRLIGTAQARQDARSTYEDAIDRGKLAVLHDEVLRGVHMVSVAQLVPGQEIAVECECVVPLTLTGRDGMVRLPQTVGQLYGASPLMPADDLVTGHGVTHHAALTVTGADAVLADRPLQAGRAVAIALDRAIELRIPDAGFAPVTGMAADGRRVSLRFQPQVTGEQPLDLAVLVDRSGSTSSRAGLGDQSIWSAISAGLAQTFDMLHDTDRIVLWQFDDRCDFLGAASGRSAARLVHKLGKPNTGTELGKAVTKLISHGARDILVLTDGQTWAGVVDDLAGSDCRISAVLVGAGSLDANIGHLVTLTGGQIYYAPGDDVAAALGSALMAARVPGTAAQGRSEWGRPLHVTCQRGGVTIAADWTQTASPAPTDAIGRFAAALALPLLAPPDSLTLALDHGLCTHATSLVLVDEAGVATNLVPETRKVPLSQPHSGGSDGPMIYSARSMLCESLPSVLDVTRDLAHAIDWDTAANLFLQGDLSQLTRAERRYLGRMCSKVAFIDAAAARGVPVEWVGLACIAAQVAGTNVAADRFVRRVLGADADQVLHRLTKRAKPETWLI